MATFRSLRSMMVLATVALVLSTRPSLDARQTSRYTAFAIDMTGIMGAQSSPLNITINKWATPEENEQVMTLLQEKGPKSLLEYLRKAPRVGGIAAPGSLGLDIRFARRIVAETGAESVLLLTDRPIGAGEAMGQTRSLEYPFSLAEFRVNSAGQGEGMITIAAKIGLDRFTKNIVIENIVDQPIKLNQIRREK